MKAKEVLDKYVKKEERAKIALIAIAKEDGKEFWFHVHEDEDIPKGYEIAIHLRNP